MYECKQVVELYELQLREEKKTTTHCWINQAKYFTIYLVTILRSDEIPVTDTFKMAT